MANPNRGEVSFEAEGKAWTLCYSANAFCELEDDLGKGTGEIVAMLQGNKVSVKVLRSVFKAGLIDNHADVDLKHAGLIMSAIGMENAGNLIGKALSLAFPDGAESDVRPPRAKAE